jgi:hypothetical protein
MPAIRKRVQSWNEGSGSPDYWAGTLAYGKDAKDRNTAYTSMWQQLAPDRGRYWFAAAGMVTGRGGIKEMESTAAKGAAAIREARDHVKYEGPLAGLVDNLPTRDDLNFVISGNAFLYPFNLHNFFTLRDKREIPGFERLRGDDLDRGLVVLEQTLVQHFIGSYPWASKALQEESLRRISGGFFSSFSSAFVRDALISMGGSSFSFGSLDERIRLGVALVAQLRRMAG